MASVWRPQPIDVYKSWVAAILTEASDDLTDWESHFVASIEMRLDKNTNLSEKQAATLEAIYTNKTK